MPLALATLRPPHPLRAVDMAAAEAEHRRIEEELRLVRIDLAVSKAKLWCLQAKGLFETMRVEGVQGLRHEPYDSPGDDIVFLIPDAKGRIKALKPNQGKADISKPIPKLRIMAQETAHLLKTS